MDEHQKTHFDQLETLRKASWDSYCNRRSYEWKISLGVWGALLALLHILIRDNTLIAGKPQLQALGTVLVQGSHSPWLQFWVAILTVWAGVLHVSFMRFIRRGHFIDQTRHERCLELQRSLMGWEDPSDVEFLVKTIVGSRVEWRSRSSWGKWLDELCKNLRMLLGDFMERILGWEQLTQKTKNDSESPATDVPLLRFTAAHKFQMGTTWLIVAAINVLLLLRLQ